MPFVGEVVARWEHDAEPITRFVGPFFLAVEGRGARDMTLTEPFGFIDPDGREWTVPAGARFNGASIPQVLWSLWGSPYTGPYRRAAVLHDYYRDQPVDQREVDRMFYHAMVEDGTDEVVARWMYLAVRLSAPTTREPILATDAIPFDELERLVDAALGAP